MNCPLSRRSMNMRLIRGEPRLPVVLYSPLSPEVNIVFINICESVSTWAGLRSPKRVSTVQTLIPIGISLSLPSESVVLRR